MAVFGKLSYGMHLLLGLKPLKWTLNLLKLLSSPTLISLSLNLFVTIIVLYAPLHALSQLMLTILYKYGLSLTQSQSLCGN